MAIAKKVVDTEPIKSTKQIVDEFIEANPIPHTFKFFHKFTNYKYDVTLHSVKKPYQEKSRLYSEYSKSKVIDYNLILANTESTILRSHHSNKLSKKPVDQNTNPYPLAIRYMDHDNGVYIVERPPFQTEIDYSFKKNVLRKQIPALQGRKIWIPWTVSVITMGSSIQSYNHRIFVANGPLNSLDDTVMNTVLPNLFSDSRICFGDSSFHLLQRIDRGEIQYNIANVFTYMFNEYFQNWNPDLCYHTQTVHTALKEMGVFDKIRSMKIKKLPKNFDDFHSWYISAGKFWFYFLYTMSFLSYEETMEFYKKISTFDQPHTAKPIKVSDLIKLETIDLQEDLYDMPADELTMSGLTGYGSWERVFASYCTPNDILRTEINVKVTNIPEGCLLNQDVVSNPNLVGFIYFQFFKKLTEEYKQYCKEKNLSNIYPQNQMDSLLDHMKVQEHNLNYHNNHENLKNNFVSFLYRSGAPLTSRPLVFSLDYNDIISNSFLDSTEQSTEMATV